MWRAHSLAAEAGASFTALPPSVEVSRQPRLQPVPVEAFNLRRQHPPERQFGQRVHWEKIDRVGFVAQGRAAPQQLAHEEQSVDMMDRRRMGMPSLVDERRQLDGSRPVAGFLEDLARHGVGRGIVHIYPAAGQGPAAIRALAYQQLCGAVEYP